MAFDSKTFLKTYARIFGLKAFVCMCTSKTNRYNCVIVHYLHNSVM